MTRTPLGSATNDDEVVARLRTIAPATVVLDAEPYGVRWGSRDPLAFRAAVANVIAKMAAVPSMRVAVVATKRRCRSRSMSINTTASRCLL